MAAGRPTAVGDRLDGVHILVVDGDPNRRSSIACSGRSAARSDTAGDGRGTRPHPHATLTSSLLTSGCPTSAAAISSSRCSSGASARRRADDGFGYDAFTASSTPKEGLRASSTSPSVRPTLRSHRGSPRSHRTPPHAQPARGCCSWRNGTLKIRGSKESDSSPAECIRRIMVRLSTLRRRAYPAASSSSSRRKRTYALARG